MDTIKRFERLDSKKAKQRFLRRCSLEELWQLSKSGYSSVLWDILAYASHDVLKQFVNCMDNSLLLSVCNCCDSHVLNRILEVCDDDTLSFILANSYSLRTVLTYASPWVFTRFLSLDRECYPYYVHECLKQVNSARFREFAHLTSDDFFSI